MEKVLLGVGAISFIGYLIWLIVCVKNWDSKIPPIVGMILSLVMILGGFSVRTDYIPILQSNQSSAQSKWNFPKIFNGNSKYVPPDNIDLAYIGVGAYYSGNTGNAGGCVPVIQNDSNKVIKNITIKYAEFDRNGYFCGESVSTATYSAINLLPGESKNLYECESYGINAGTIYIEGIISNIEFMDGSVWESDAVERWSQQMEQGLDLSNRESPILNMKQLADKAITNDFMTISLDCFSEDYGDYTKVSFNADVKDIGELAITSFTFTMLCYDSRGLPVNTKQGILSANSISYTFSESNIYSLAHGEGIFSFGLDEEIKSVTPLISEISFSNGDVWKNQYAPYWELYYGDVIGK